MSSQDSMTMVLKCMLKGAADYLIKPMRKNELKNLWQHVWRRLTLRDGHTTAHGLSLPASQKNLEDTDETSADSRYHPDHESGDQGDVVDDSGRTNKKLESIDVTMDLIGGIDKRLECFYGDNTCDECVGPELRLSLKRSCSGSFQDKTKQQKLSHSDESAFSRYESSQPGEKADVAVERSSLGEPKTPSESHEKLRRVRSDHGSATTSSNQVSSSISGQNESSFHNQVTKQKQHQQDSQSRSSSTEKAQVEEGGGLSVQERWSLREAALMKFRLKRKDRCFDKKVRYQSRKKLAEQRPRVKGQFVRAVNSDASK